MGNLFLSQLGHKFTAPQVQRAPHPLYKGANKKETAAISLTHLSQISFLTAARPVPPGGGSCPPGTGKTLIALAVGNKTLDAGNKVFFASMDSLMHVHKTQDILRVSFARLKWMRESYLLIIDEMGYLSVSKVEASLFF